MNTCSVEECDRPRHGTSDWCNGHYQRWKRSGDLRSDVPLGDGRKRRFCIRGHDTLLVGRTGRICKECARDHCRRLQGRDSLIGKPALSKKEIQALGVKTRSRNRLEKNKGLLRVVHAGDPKAEKLIELMFNEGATDAEKTAAKLALRKRREAWPHQTITSVETGSTQPVMKSPLALASSQGE